MRELYLIGVYDHYERRGRRYLVSVDVVDGIREGELQARKLIEESLPQSTAQVQSSRHVCSTPDVVLEEV